MRVVVTLIRPDGTMRAGWLTPPRPATPARREELLARALAVLPPYRAVPGGASAIFASMTRLSWSRAGLVRRLYHRSSVLAIGEPPR